MTSRTVYIDTQDPKVKLILVVEGESYKQWCDKHNKMHEFLELFMFRRSDE